jgi:membrane-bound lytic murein transglycosylase D
MRLNAHAALRLALIALGIGGCAVTRHPSSDLQSWTWEPPASTSQATPLRQYGLSVNPYQASGSVPDDSNARQDEFNFSHPRVDDFLTRFQTDLRGFFSGALSRSGRYVPRMSSILEKEGVPQELAYLPLIESGFRPLAVSRAGAVGPWQLIPGTGRRYGLRIDRYVDERCDPVKSTQAAARYLKDLHEMFGDWHLSLAAYNTGEGHISRILEGGEAEDFWEMSDRGFLYQETENFVPEFLAALQIAEAPETYGFDVPEEEHVHYDMVRVNRSLSLSTVARLTHSTTQDIKELNPALHRGVTPPREYAMRVPKGTKQIFEVAYADLGREVPQARRHPASVRRGKSARGKHTLRRGVTVASLAKGHRASAKTAHKAKGIRKARGLKPGRTARVRAVARRGGSAMVVAGKRSRSRIID